MIYYFSGTGNSEWIANELARKLGEEAVSITKISGSKAIEPDGKSIGLVFPIYAWAVPELMIEFVKNHEFPKNTFLYMVCTCGSEAGDCVRQLEKYVSIQSAYSIAMPSNYIVGSEVETKSVIREKLGRAKELLDIIAEEVQTKQSVNQVTTGSMPKFKGNVIGKAFNRFSRQTKPFAADDTCTGCGLCEKNCPTGTIHIVNNKPQWGNYCAQCLSCINRCPVRAIQYGKKTQKRSRYYLKNGVAYVNGKAVEQ